MWKVLMRWFRGYVIVLLNGIAQERFINICKLQGLHIWGVQKKKNEIYCNIRLSDFWYTRKIAKKTKVMPKIIGRIGFPFLVNQIQKKRGIVFGFVSGIWLMYLLSMFVWDISVTGQSVCTQEEMLRFLKKYNIESGMRRAQVDCQEIEEKIREKYANIGWVAAELKGTKLSIVVVENNEVHEMEEKADGSHLVAEKDGIIRSIVTRTGVPCVVSGDSVKKGDILISGILLYKDENGNTMKPELVHADGDILIEMDGTFEKKQKYLGEKRVYTGKKQSILEFQIAQKKIYLKNPLNRFDKNKKYDIIADVCKVSLSKSFVLPIQYGRIKYREYENKSVAYSKEQIKKNLNKQYTKYRKEKIEEGILFERENKWFQIGEDGIILHVSYKMLKPVQSHRKVTESEWRQEDKNGINGDNDRGSNGT